VDSSKQARSLLQIGIALILTAALLGLVIPYFTVPRLALSSHLIGMLQGIVLVVTGLLWPQLSLAHAQFAIAFWLIAYQAVAAYISNILAAAWGAGNSIIPLAAGAAHGSAGQELVINLGLRSAGAALIIALALILWGLRRRSLADSDDRRG
jgi:hydroxylaminobenzene mutase